MIFAEKIRYFEQQKNARKKIREEAALWAQHNVAVQAVLGRQSTFHELYAPIAQGERQGLWGYPCVEQLFPAYTQDLEACIGGLGDHSLKEELLTHPYTMGTIAATTTASIAARNPSWSRRKILVAGCVGLLGGTLQGFLQGTQVQQQIEIQLIRCAENALYLDEVVEKYA